LLNCRLGFEDWGALTELTLADRVDAVGCGGLGGLVFGWRCGNAEVGTIFDTMGCLRLGTARF
jgi:hypothetical protein